MQARLTPISFVLVLLFPLCICGADISARERHVEDNIISRANSLSKSKAIHFRRPRGTNMHSQTLHDESTVWSKRQMDPESFVSNAIGSNQGSNPTMNDNGGNGNFNQSPSNSGTSETPSGGTSPTSTPKSSTGTNQNCNTNASPGGCANEDGPASGDPGWTCGAGTNQASTRDLFTSSRLAKRQSAPDYVATMNSWRCKFCLQPYAYDAALEQSAQTQSNNAASQGAMIETPPNGQGTIMAQGTGADFQTAVLFWLCEVHTTNIDSCTCANTYTQHGFQWTERGHYDFLVGKQASEFKSIGCVFNEALGGLWTCALGMV